MTNERKTESIVRSHFERFKDLVEIARDFAFILQYYTDDPNDGDDILKVIKAYNKEKYKGNKFIQSLFNLRRYYYI